MSHVRPRILPARLHAATASSRLLIGLLAFGVLLGPALVASSVTSQEQPVSFASSPWLGWSFLGEVVAGASGARAASPGAALRIAQDRFRDPAGPIATRARLAYAPGDRPINFEALTQQGLRPAQVTPDEPLVWLIDGSHSLDARAAEGVIGIIGYASGRSRYDVRDEDLLAEATAPPAASAATKEGTE